MNSIQTFLRGEAVWIPDSHYLLTAWTDDRQMKPPSVIDFTAVDGSIRPRVIDYRQFEKWRRKGHEFIELYVANVVGDRVKTEIRHTAIFSIAARGGPSIRQ